MGAYAEFGVAEPKFATYADRDGIEAEMPYGARAVPSTLYEFLSHTAETHPSRPAVSFQLLSDPAAPSETLTWREVHGRTTQAANLFRRLGVGPGDTVAYLLPNCSETVAVLMGGAVAGIVNPINPLLEPEQIAAILRETRAKVLVTLRSFPKTDVAQKAAEAVKFAPNVKTVLEVDLLRYLTGAKRLLVPLLRPKNNVAHHADVLDFTAEAARERADALAFDDPSEDRIAAYFHTGGTTGLPKIAQHRYSGMIYNGWIGRRLIFHHTDVLMCPLPLFHVFAAYPVLMSCLASGAHLVLPTPAGYRGEGVFDNFWKLVERYRVTFLITVPTALAALMQRPVNADISSLRVAISGSAPLPVELINRFRTTTGIDISEGYGLTEATCLVSCNPASGIKKVGSVGIPFPHTEVRIFECDDHGEVLRECATEEVGEICVASPGVHEERTYTQDDKNTGLYARRVFLRTGDLGKLDSDGYLYITGRKKDLIIRGGHNIDPSEIEDALSGHPEVAFVAAIGQPDSYAGEVPAVYVEPIAGARPDIADLMDYARRHIAQRAAIPKHIELIDQLPKSAVGKVLKFELRKLAIARVFDATFEAEGLDVRVRRVVEDRSRGLVARLEPPTADAEATREAAARSLGMFAIPWEWDE
jgi:fatty-acyl-CoA synthase